MSASLIGRSGSSAFRLSTNSVSTPLAGSCFSSESAPRPFHHGIRRRGGTIFGAAFAVRLTAGPSGHAISPHPSSREGHHSTARWSSSVLLSDLILHGCHAAAGFLVQPELGAVNPDAMMVTGNWRARATIAFCRRCRRCSIAEAWPGPFSLSAPGGSGPLRRASPASSDRHTAISRRFDRSRPIDTWKV